MREAKRLVDTLRESNLRPMTARLSQTSQLTLDLDCYANGVLAIGLHLR